MSTIFQFFKIKAKRKEVNVQGEQRGITEAGAVEWGAGDPGQGWDRRVCRQEQEAGRDKWLVAEERAGDGAKRGTVGAGRRGKRKEQGKEEGLRGDVGRWLQTTGAEQGGCGQRAWIHVTREQGRAAGQEQEQGRIHKGQGQRLGTRPPPTCRRLLRSCARWLCSSSSCACPCRLPSCPSRCCSCPCRAAFSATSVAFCQEGVGWGVG